MTEHTDPEARLLADLDWVLAQAAPAQSGAVWRLAEEGRQVEANLIRLRPGQRIDTHQERDVDVLLLPVAGSGALYADSGPIPLTPHALSWLPRGSRRSIEAGPDGLAYMTVHRTRTGMTIRMPGESEAPVRRPSSAKERNTP